MKTSPSARLPTIEPPRLTREALSQSETKPLAVLTAAGKTQTTTDLRQIGRPRIATPSQPGTDPGPCRLRSEPMGRWRTRCAASHLAGS